MLHLRRWPACCLCLVWLPLAAMQEANSWKSVEDYINRTPPAMAGLNDVRHFEPWFGTLTPGDYANNRELARRMLTYFATVEMVARDSQLRIAARRAHQHLLMLGFASATQGGPTDVLPVPEPAYVPAAPPFQREAPATENIAEKDRPLANELQSRYEAAAGQAATAWQSAEVIRRALRARQMELNVQTEVALTRTRLYLETAAEDLRDKAWADARTNIERAEYEAGKVFAAVGR